MPGQILSGNEVACAEVFAIRFVDRRRPRRQSVRYFGCHLGDAASCIASWRSRKYEEELRDIDGPSVSFSTNHRARCREELLDSIEATAKRSKLRPEDVWRNENEPYRIKLTYMIEEIPQYAGR